MRKPFLSIVERRRVLVGPYRSHRGAPHGLFMLPIGNGGVLRCLASGASPVSEGWEHVSVTVEDADGASLDRCPTWEEMSEVKWAFWDDDETVVQIHPPARLHVNVHPYCLHLWRHSRRTGALPPARLIG